ncbi:sensor histidine kinase [Halpernia frigidisoli]|uniref:sensor histidine kinase n=1 Tax=Halpernia frigidisoli TaxID=1125876 RepID=UPI000B7D1647|nr:HAMP domain-containing sensor histidine kinase [Halpernia frigidisoli]
MNNKFIPIISVFMTISLVVFTSFQFYWLKGYYSALEQEFSNKVYSALESSAKTINEIEINKYLNEDYKNFGKTVLAGKNQPSLTTISQVEDSASRRSLTYTRSILEQQNIPISKRGDSLKLATLRTDENLIRLKLDSTERQPLTTDLSRSLENGDYTTKEFAGIVGSNLPISKRVNDRVLDSVVTKELKIRGISTPIGFAVFDKNEKPTKIVNSLFKKEEKDPYRYPLFTDGQDRTLFTLNLVFPRKDYSLARNNLPMLLGTFMSLLTILGIYIISINYMMRQKKIAEVKTDFINNMSHEFKTPLATISVATDSLANDKIATNPEKVKYYSALIKQENLRMKKQVENVLNMSKLERNEMELFLKETDVRALINRMADSFKLIVEKRDGVIEKDFTATKHIFKIDEFHMSNALINLLDNANKYSPEAPKINIKTKNEGNWYVIEIKDQGMGMETLNKGKIFEKFFREETGNIHNVKGQGLGLSYVKKIIELHKGQILVESAKDQGSTFTIKLPMV